MKIFLSQRIRRLYGLPLYGPTGLPEWIELAIKNELVRHWEWRGYLAERRFFESWTQDELCRHGFVSVRATGKFEDMHDRRDAMMVKKDLREIRIQIKCSPGAENQFADFEKRGIVLVVVLLSYTPKQIIAYTMNAIVRYYESKKR